MQNQIHASSDLKVRKHLIDLRFGVADASFQRDEFVQGFKAMTITKDNASGRQIAIIFVQGVIRMNDALNILNTAMLHVIVFNDLTTACVWLNVDFQQTHQMLEGLSRPMKIEYRERHG